MMDEWAVVHPITALAYEKFGTEAWVWYRGLGLWKYDTFSRKFSQATKGFLASAGVNAIASYGPAMVLAGPGGITLIGADGERWQQMNRMFNADLAGQLIVAAAFDDRDVFAGTGSGILAFKRGEDFVRNITTYDGLPSDRINCLYLEGDSLWAGTDYGLGLYQRSIKTTTSLWPQLENHKISGISADPRYIYLATGRGAVKLDRQDSLRPLRYQDPDPALLEEPMLAVISEDTITWWLGKDFLLAGNKRDGSYRTFLRSGNYAAGHGLCLAVDDGNVWIGTDNGLVRFVKSRNQFMVYHAADGLLDEQVWSLYSLNGCLWAGGANGASRFCFKKEDQ
jgi:ligand-binding sensor domain-containing protein